MDKIIFLLLGIVLIVFGLSRLFRRHYHDILFDWEIDFGSYHYLFGIFGMIVGVIFIYLSFKKSAKNPPPRFSFAQSG